MRSNPPISVARSRRRPFAAVAGLALLALGLTVRGKGDGPTDVSANDEMADGTSTNEAMVKEAIESIWNRGELDRIPEFYTEDFVSHQPKEGFRWNPGHGGLHQLLTSTRRLFPDYHENIEDAVASGDRVVLRLRNTGTLAKTMAEDAPKSFEVTDFMLVRVANGKIAEQWGLFDLYGMYVQLGVIEPPRLAPVP